MNFTFRQASLAQLAEHALRKRMVMGSIPIGGLLYSGSGHVQISEFFKQARGSLCCNWPVGLMDKASASGAGDSRFESWTGHVLLCACQEALHSLRRLLALSCFDALSCAFLRSFASCALPNSANTKHLIRNQRAHGVVVSHPLSMREALGPIPSMSRREM